MVNDLTRYRFVWAGHTYLVWRDMNHQQRDKNYTDDKQEETAGAWDFMRTRSETEDGILPKCDMYDTDEVVDPNAMLEEDDEDEDENEGEERSREEINLVPDFRELPHPPRCMREDEGLDEAEETKEDEEVTFESVPSVVNVFFAHPAISQTLDQIESHYFEMLEVADRTLANPVPSAPTFSPFGQASEMSAPSKEEPLEEPFVRPKLSTLISAFEQEAQDLAMPPVAV